MYHVRRRATAVHSHRSRSRDGPQIALLTAAIAQNIQRRSVLLASALCEYLIGQRTRMKYFCAQVHTKTDSSDAQDRTAMATRRGRAAGIFLLIDKSQLQLQEAWIPVIRTLIAFFNR